MSKALLRLQYRRTSQHCTSIDDGIRTFESGLASLEQRLKYKWVLGTFFWKTLLGALICSHNLILPGRPLSMSPYTIRLMELFEISTLKSSERSTNWLLHSLHCKCRTKKNMISFFNSSCPLYSMILAKVSMTATMNSYAANISQYLD